MQNIFVSDVTIRQTTAVLKGSLKDFFYPAKNRDFDFEFKTEEVTSLKNQTWFRANEKIFYWLPNTVSLDLISSQTSLVSAGVTYEAESSHTDDFWGHTLGILSAIGLRRIEPSSKRPGWRYRFLMVPSAALAYSKEVFPSFPLLKDMEFVRLHLDAGYGPSFNYGDSQWNFYFNFIPVLAFDQIQAHTPNGKFSGDRTGVTAMAELGLMYYFDSNWNIRVFSRSVTVDENVWQKVIDKAVGAPTDLQLESLLLTSGISIGYIVPSRIVNRSNR